MIKLRNIDKSYHMGENTLHVLKNISLDVENGEFISIVGASGSGKSTLMNIIGCMDSLDKGSYFLDNVAIHELNDSECANIRNKKIGFIFQKYHLIPQYTIFQNAMMPLLISGMRRNDAIPLVEETLNMVGLSNRKKHKPNELSGGQQQRAAIARAMVTNPSLLLADEPTGALDSETGKEILTLFQELNKKGHTIIQITHDAKVAEYSNRIVTLVDGVINL